VIQILRLDFVATQKRWEANKAREAPNAERDLDDYVSASWNAGSPRSGTLQQQDAPAYVERCSEEEADQILDQENRELDALISSMDASHEDQDALPQSFGSDDEDYDSLFMDLLSAQESEQRNSVAQAYYDDDDMDTSLG